MALTSFATSDGLCKKAWEEQLFRDVVKESYFSKFMGKGANSLVQEKTQLEKDKGDDITIGIRMRLAGAGVTSGETLEGNEEALSTYHSHITLEEYAHGVRDRGPLDRQRAMFSIDQESQDALKDWMAEKIDALSFTAIGTPTKTFYRSSTGAFTGTATAATAKTGCSSTYKLNTSFISALKAWAKTGGARAYVPLRPVKIEGAEYYVLLVHPNAMYDLKVDSTFQGALKDAQLRGADNPLFKGASAIWDGVVIHEHENLTVGTNAGASSNVPYSLGVFMGAQALCLGFGKRPVVVQEEFDYGRQHGYSIQAILGVAKPVFNSLDYGSLGVCLASSSISAQ